MHSEPQVEEAAQLAGTSFAGGREGGASIYNVCACADGEEWLLDGVAKWTRCRDWMGGTRSNLKGDESVVSRLARKN